MEKATKIEEAVLPFKVQQLVEIIMQKKSMNFVDALGYLYSTECYRLLQFEDAKLWYLSGTALYDMIEAEKHAKWKISADNRKQTLFLIFCLEKCKDAIHNKNAEETLKVFSALNVFEFLQENFETLHTQGEQYIIEAITDFIRTQPV